MQLSDPAQEQEAVVLGGEIDAHRADVSNSAGRLQLDPARLSEQRAAIGWDAVELYPPAPREIDRLGMLRRQSSAIQRDDAELCAGLGHDHPVLRRSASSEVPCVVHG